MSAGAQEELARAINADFDRLINRQRSIGSMGAIQAAKASAFAVVAFLDQYAGRQETLGLISELIDA